MALSWGKEHEVTCTNTTGCDHPPFPWRTAHPEPAYPIPAWVRRYMEADGWMLIRDWTTGPGRWLCPEHAAARYPAPAPVTR